MIWRNRSLPEIVIPLTELHRLGCFIYNMLYMRDFKCNQTIKGHSDYINCLEVISPELITSGSRDKTIKFCQLKETSSFYLFKSKEFQCIKTIEGHSSPVESLKLISKEFLLTSFLFCQFFCRHSGCLVINLQCW